jgi:transposase InsO family protein
MIDVSVKDRIALLSDNGAGYISRQFSEYIRLVGIRQITASPYRPQGRISVLAADIGQHHLQ